MPAATAATRIMHTTSPPGLMSHEKELEEAATVTVSTTDLHVDGNAPFWGVQLSPSADGS
jgi:hypothetical protein